MPGSLTLIAAVAAGLAGGPIATERAQNTRPLAPSMRLLSGSSGNVVVVAGEEGLILIDDQRASDRLELAEASADLPSQRVAYVINTHWHLDHTGANAALGMAGAQIIAHEAVRIRLASDQYMADYDEHIPASP
jgi:cyclase